MSLHIEVVGTPIKAALDTDIELSDLLTQVRASPTPQEGFNSLSDDKRAFVREAMANIQPGQTVDQLIELGVKKRALLVTGAEAPQGSPQGARIEDEAVLAEFEQFRASQTPIDPRSAFVSDQLKQGANAEEITSVMLELGQPQEDIDQAIIGAGRELSDLMEASGAAKEDILQAFTDKGFSEEQVRLIGDQSDLARAPAPPTDGVAEGAPQPLLAPVTVAGQTKALNQLISDTSVDPEQVSIEDLDSMSRTIYSKYSTRSLG